MSELRPVWGAHGTILGPEFSGPVETTKILDAAGLNWIVERQNCYTSAETGNIQIPQTFALVQRPGDRFFGICTNRYSPLQNKEMFQFVQGFFNRASLELSVAGSMGCWVYALGKSKYHFSIGTGKDRFQVYMLIARPHETGRGIRPFLFLHRPENETCLVYPLMTNRQQFEIPLDDVWSTAKTLACELLAKQLGQVMMSIELKAVVMSETRASMEAVKAYYQKLECKGARSMVKIPPHRLSQLLELFKDGYGSSAPSCAGTWWGAHQTLCYLLDHLVCKTEEIRIIASWFDHYADLKRKSLELAYQLAKEKYAQNQIPY